MANYLVTDTELTQVANAIRAKSRATGSMVFPVGFVNTISGIPEKAAATYNTSTSDQTIPSGRYLAGAQTIRGVTTSNLSAANIKAGVTVKVGDAADDDRIAGVTGTFTSDANAAAGDILPGKTSYVNGNKVTGNMPTLGAVTYNTSASNQTIPSGRYLSGAQTIRGVTTSNLSAANIKAGVTVKVGDAGDDDRIAGVTGTFTSDANATAGDIRYGKTAYVNGNKLTGTYRVRLSSSENTYYVGVERTTLHLYDFYNHEITIPSVPTDVAPYAADLYYGGLLVKSGLPVKLNGSTWKALCYGYENAGSTITFDRIRVYSKHFAVESY